MLDRGAVVERAVEAAVQVGDVVDRRSDAVAVGEVAGDGVGDAAGGPDAGDDAVEGVDGASSENNARSLTGEQAGRCRADAAARAGDEDDLAGEQALGGGFAVGHGDQRHRLRGADTGTIGTRLPRVVPRILGPWTSTSWGCFCGTVARG
ncbi:hypothetical protein Ahu01nite_078040 [Winogradskya humida]|uniref:Uncharacterized protein n=1 Tax=Winogradskya humida TaxID=113566 RepID=A0ABQ4A1J7_9ACTN|nr:hypothetical protein Ahu01nite_078040 [Actinoplanes humidus]